MLFHIFHTQDERKTFGGSAFIEIQFCRLPSATKTAKKVKVSSIHHWQNDSLYIHVNDVEIFAQEYSRIFNCGVYGNLKNGMVDLYGINYYEPSFIDPMIDDLRAKKPLDYEILIKWLNKSKEYNGFYILGI